jgi:uncharacterized hydrophobic protein (TIGR00341 family)
MRSNSQDPVCDVSQPEATLLKELKKLGTKTDTLDRELVLLAVLAGIVALFGLFLNNVSVIIGAMVISPLLEPLYAGVVYLASGHPRVFLKHVFVLFCLIIVIILVSFLITYFGTLFQTLQVTPEIISRTTSIDIYTPLAILLGFTAVLSHKRGFITSVVGIGIAVALVPPAVVVGISSVIYPSGLIHAIQLTFNNILGMLAGMLICIILLGTGRRCEKGMQLSRNSALEILLAILGLLVITFLLNYLPTSLLLNH